MPNHNLVNVGAVPGTANKRRGHWFRRPRNISVKRALLSMYETLKSVKTPPDSYDDISIKAYKNHNWKRHRLTRWR